VHPRHQLAELAGQPAPHRFRAVPVDHVVLAGPGLAVHHQRGPAHPLPVGVEPQHARRPDPAALQRAQHRELDGPVGLDEPTRGVLPQDQRLGGAVGPPGLEDPVLARAAHPEPAQPAELRHPDTGVGVKELVQPFLQLRHAHSRNAQPGLPAAQLS
jgi:hypothetical protein